MGISYSSNKIKDVMNKKGLSVYDVVRKINKLSSKKLKSICRINIDRLVEIIDGDSPTVLECTIISQAIGGDLGSFHRADIKN